MEGITKTIDGVKVLDNISFILGHDDKVALVGSNELAKTTLFQILSGEMEPDDGSYKWGLPLPRPISRRITTQEFDNDDTIVDWLTQYSPDQGRYLCPRLPGTYAVCRRRRREEGKGPLRRREGALHALQDDDLRGQRADFDEPTDHLDMESITALNNGMKKFPGVMIFSSRDHQVVETTANRIMEIINGQLVDKITTYDEYLASDEMARKRFTFTVTESQEDDD